ncbi:hypothetical protein CK203_090511 [Vitis vinifera]|uniref:Retrovirus-related Pol polyprotein from transposon RE1 n=1 Tax=Vitis vinifera TaxID=29760 RepID=A0A438BTT8_VITVI|nr:hypothetical protein CK203_090511 [Vitis vinifera]
MSTSEKLVGSENYLSRSASVELWFMGQGYEDHLVTQEADIPRVDTVQWRKIDAQLCSVLWQSVDPKILLHFRAYKTCFKFWNQAKGLYTNDIQRLYKVASSIVNVRQQDMDLSTYIGQIASLKEEFLTVMPLTTDVGDQRTQIDKFFMVLTLIGLRPDLETVRDQILGSSSVPSLDDVFARLLRISSTQTLPSDNTSDSSVLVSQTNSQGGRSGNRANGSQTVAKGIGLAHTLPSLPLTFVLYTPECSFNLISISKITRTLNFFEDSPFFSTSESLPVSEVLPFPIISPPDAVPSRPLQVYHRHHRVVVPPLAEVPANLLPIPSASPAPALPPFADLPIAL